MKVLVNGKWHTLKPGEFIFFDHITKTVSIRTISFTGDRPE